MKKIALVADVENWAFDIAAHIIKNSLSKKYKIDIYYSKSDIFQKDLFKILESLKEYDLIHFFWRGILLDFENEEFKKKVINTYGNYDKYLEKIIPKISTGVYDHLFQNDIQFIKKFTKYCNKYVVSSSKLYNIYSNLSYDEIKKPYDIIGDSFEKEKFYPKNIDRFYFNNELVIGWVGNSLWNEKEKDKNGNPIDFKGYRTILKPVIDELIKEGYNIKLDIADKNIRPINNDCMCDYYKNIHVYVCTSAQEGTPKPLLEAMGCAVPIITTDVGIAKDALGEKQQKFIIGERIINKNDDEIRKNLKEKIIELYNNRSFLKELSDENYKNSSKYEISEMKLKYSKLFEDSI